MLEIREMVSFELGKDIEKDVFSSCRERGTKKKKKKFWVPIRSQTSDLRIRRSGARKFTISLIYINKHYALDIADLSSIQDTCHMNVVIDFAHRGVSVVRWLEHRSVESKGLRFDSSLVLRIFSVSHARDKKKKHLSLLIILLFSSQSILSTWL